MADVATLQLKIDASGAHAGAMGFSQASAKIQQGAHRAMLAISAYTTMAVREYVKFEEQMANVSTMLDQQTMRYMPAYGRAVKRMAIEFGEGSATLSTGLYNILSASIKAEDAVATLDVAVRSAKAGLTDTATATYAITGILNAYSLSADKAGKVSDILFSTVKRGQTTFGQLAPVVGRVTAISSGAGIALEEVSAALSTITRGGISTDEAITGLRQAIIALQGQQDAAVGIARQHGVELSNSALAAEGLTGMLKKLSGLSESVISDIFKEVRARVSLSVLLKDQAGYVNDYEEALNSAGKTQEAYNKMTNTLGHSFRRLWQTIKVGAVEAGEAFAPEMKKITDMILEQDSAWRHYSRSYGEGVAEILSGFESLKIITQTSIRLSEQGLNLARQQGDAMSGARGRPGFGAVTGPAGPTAVETEALVISPRGYQRIAEMRANVKEQAEFDEWLFRATHRLPEERRGTYGTAQAEGEASEGQKQYAAEQLELAHKRADITARMYDDMGKLGTGYYQAQKELLELEAMDYDVFIEDKALLDEWYFSKLQLLAVESSGFWLETRSALQGTQSALSDFMMDFASLEGLIDSIGQSFQRMFANLASQIAMSGIMNLLVGGDMAGALGFQNPMAGAGKAAIGGVLGALFGGGATPIYQAHAMGGVFDRGRLVPMASGDVFNRPTYFPLAGGKIGLMGEGGTEAAMPLKRMSSGRLGVETGGTQPITVNPTPVKIVIVADRKAAALEAMRSSEGQAQIIGTLREHGII